jgi:outer membrane protein
MKKQIIAAAIAGLIFSGSAIAHEPGDVIVRVGAAHVAPDVSNGKVKFSSTDPTEPNDSWGWKAKVSSDTQLGLTATWIVAPHFGVELLASTPFSHTFKDVDGKYAKVKMLSPTVSAQYFFLDPKSRFQPYVGLGLNYTRFYDEKLVGDTREDGASYKLKNSLGLAAQVGLDFAITDKLVLNAAIWKIDINTKETLKEPYGSYTDTYKSKIELDPWVYFVGIGYKF